MNFKIDNNAIDDIKLSSDKNKFTNYFFDAVQSIKLNENVLRKILNDYLQSNELRKFKYLEKNDVKFLIMDLASNKYHIPEKLEKDLNAHNWKEYFSTFCFSDIFRKMQGSRLADYEKKQLSRNSYIEEFNNSVFKGIFEQLCKIYNENDNAEVSTVWLSPENYIFLANIYNKISNNYQVVIGLSGKSIPNILSYFEIKEETNYKILNKNIRKFELKNHNYVQTKILDKAAYKLVWKRPTSDMLTIFDTNNFKKVLKAFDPLNSNKKEIRTQYSDIYTNHLHTYYISRIFNCNYNNDIKEKLSPENMFLLDVKSTIDGTVLMLVYIYNSFIELFLIDNSDFSILDKDFIEENRYYEI